MEAKTIRDLKQGEYFTMKAIDEPCEAQVWVREHYDRGSKRYCVTNYANCGREKFLKGDTVVYVDFYF